MRLPWNAIKPQIKPGTVFRDSQFKHLDGIIEPKWIVILSEVVESNYFYCLSTSDFNTYQNVHYSKFVKTAGSPFIVPTIIEIERISGIDVRVLEIKYQNGTIDYKGCIDNSLLDEINEKIRISPVIEDDIKDFLKLFDSL